MYPGATESDMQGVQLHTHFLTAVFGRDRSFPKNMMNITSLHTYILEASAAPGNINRSSMIQSV